MDPRIEFARRAAKALTSLSREDQLRITISINLLADTPFPPGFKKLKGYDGIYRIRVGDYRVLYSVQDSEIKILVLDLGHRKDIYR